MAWMLDAQMAGLSLSTRATVPSVSKKKEPLLAAKGVPFRVPWNAKVSRLPFAAPGATAAPSEGASGLAEGLAVEGSAAPSSVATCGFGGDAVETASAEHAGRWATHATNAARRTTRPSMSTL